MSALVHNVIYHFSTVDNETKCVENESLGEVFFPLEGIYRNTEDASCKIPTCQTRCDISRNR